ncbi:ABC transporter ATP-binding protein [Enterococcus casseliflavus]|mgnify:FL=1|uniref:ABC transporter ATP-binding protein n=1 Tax=Enterococcus casseliflavus TaxID=37734 RepID=UPI000EAD530E|nr:ABC transporter ATP-binding protein [Enterococcus casseliflavus]AYJ45878.1 ABC transporter ATP-binding protein [Enterococcus casseliflavus]MBS5814676.1 ABC transporter ATP-binding protein [Enterococcus casseliflavus]MCD4963197.1 ABC transporter ATP-binding protein [Enterococcus casseliflavus]MDT2974310.1 ABC transporter ATP-binding protein [Enterococcus casseliflavus]
MLSIQNLSVNFGDKQILKNISFDLPEKAIIGLVAPNGTGKTTMMKAILGQVSRFSGEITLNGEDYTSLKKKSRLLENVSLLPDQSELFEEFTGIEHLELYKSIWKSSKKVETIVGLLQMEDYAKKRVATYSLGMRQRLCFAMQVIGDTSYMFMDEVMNGLDPTNVLLVSTILQQLAAEGKAIMVSSHILYNLEEISQQILFLKDGVMFEYNDPKKSLMEKYQEIYVKSQFSIN